MEKYEPNKIEKKWQEVWEKEQAFFADNSSKKPKYYILVEFPYPSGTGLHVGHCRSYVGMDIIARKRRMDGFNVLFPMGWDAFGLPTENYAVKTGIHPAVATKNNTNHFKRQEKILGLSFDWQREINTTDPSYYKWTQWIFLQLFKNGLAYKKKMPINWCPSCKIGLANEEVLADGKCERCGARVVRKEREQWLLKITNYAQRLIKDLDLVDYPEKVKTSQKEWIGRSDGVEIQFPMPNDQCPISVFTTRVDTLFGCTYLVLSPENPLIEKLRPKIENWKAVEEYIGKAKTKLEKDRISGDKEKDGVQLKGISVENPANGRQIPVFVSEYVLMHYGKGAVMAVPAHDQRDFEFAKKYNLAIIDVIKPEIKTLSFEEKAYEEEGILINSGRFDGMRSETARQRITEWLESQGKGKRAIYYKLRDWIFSRQRYWGEPIPMINCQKCGWVPVPEKDLPVVLPKVDNYKPTEKGDSPLVQAEKWVNTSCPKCGNPAKRETDVMPNWAGSNWYYLRYCDPKNDKELASKESLEYWMAPARRSPKGVGGVDWYNGGMEHTTLHLLYSRFIFKFLWDIGKVPREIGPEPYKKRTSHGVILGEGGIKMSKSKGNVIDPEDVIKKYGADTLRLYEMFIGPFGQMIPWDTKGVVGCRRFFEKIYKLVLKSQIQNFNDQSNPLDAERTPRRVASKILNLELKKILHKTIKKVSEDIEVMKFNTAVSSMMEFTNAWSVSDAGLDKKDLSDFLKILSPFAPHLAEELWQEAGFKGLCCVQNWPKYDEGPAKEEKTTLVIQINGKVRDKIEVAAGVSRKEAETLALKSEKIKTLIGKSEI